MVSLFFANDCELVGLNNNLIYLYNFIGLLITLLLTTLFILIKKKYTKELDYLKQLAFYDPLTNLPNRRMVYDRMDYTIALAERKERIFAILMIDLDKFKPVNDTLGHAAGDELLQQVAGRISKQLRRRTDMVARFGGDEFIIFLDDITEQRIVEKIAESIISTLTTPFKLSSTDEVQISTSIGVSFFPKDGMTKEVLLNCADAALYQAKNKGRGCFIFHEYE